MRQLLGAINDAEIDDNYRLGTTGQFFLVGPITDESCSALGQNILRLLAAGVLPNSNAMLHINSGGGSIEAGWMLRQLVEQGKRKHRLHLTTVVAGIAMSMGLVIAQFGCWRQVDRFSTVMFHRPQQSVGFKDVAGTQSWLHELSNSEDAINTVMAERNTAGHTDLAFWSALCRSGDSCFSAEERLALGMFDEIV